MNDTPGSPLMGMTSAVSIFQASQRYFNFQLQHTTDITEQIYTQYVRWSYLVVRRYPFSCFSVLDDATVSVRERLSRVAVMATYFVSLRVRVNMPTVLKIDRFNDVFVLHTPHGRFLSISYYRK